MSTCVKDSKLRGFSGNCDIHIDIHYLTVFGLVVLNRTISQSSKIHLHWNVRLERELANEIGANDVSSVCLNLKLLNLTQSQSNNLFTLNT